MTVCHAAPEIGLEVGGFFLLLFLRLGHPVFKKFGAGVFGS
jgi:hypothetical protein